MTFEQFLREKYIQNCDERRDLSEEIYPDVHVYFKSNAVFLYNQYKEEYPNEEIS